VGSAVGDAAKEPRAVPTDPATNWLAAFAFGLDWRGRLRQQTVAGAIFAGAAEIVGGADDADDGPAAAAAVEEEKQQRFLGVEQQAVVVATPNDQTHLLMP